MLTVATATVLATSCTRVVTDARVVAAPDMGKAAVTAADCTSVDVPMTTIRHHTDEEPVLRIPQPDGVYYLNPSISPDGRLVAVNRMDP